MTRPVLHSYRGQQFTLAQLASLTGIAADTLRHRLALGWTIEQAVTVPTPAQRRRGVVVNFPGVSGTGPGSTAQETPEITFSEEANS